MHKFYIDIWLDQIPHSIKLGTIAIHADTEERAMELAHAHTRYELTGVDETSWEIREPQHAYASSIINYQS